MAQHKIQCKPPVLSCKSYLMGSFNDWIAIVTSLPRLRSSRFEVEPGNLRDPSLDLPSTKTYSSIFTELMNVSPSPMLRGYRAIHQVVTAVELHVDQWTQHQSLWDMEFRHIYPRVKQDMALWQQLLREIEEAKAKIDSTSPHTLFGPIMVCSSVQAVVSDKHDVSPSPMLRGYRAIHQVVSNPGPADRSGRDPGRKSLSHRFLRHHPGLTLSQLYGTYTGCPFSSIF